MNKASVCLSTDLIHHHGDLKNYTVVIVDILRATTCMLTAFMEGCDHIMPFSDLNACYEMKSKDYLIAGEREGSKVEGFDLGNSPFDYMELGVKGRKIAMTTTNGTQALYASKKASKVYIGSFLNISALSEELLASEDPVLIFCAGWKGRPNTEDTLFTGMLISKLQEKGWEMDGDEALLSLDFYLKNRSEILKIIKSSAHAKRLSALTDIEKDLNYASLIDECSLVPFYENDIIKITDS